MHKDKVMFIGSFKYYLAAYFLPFVRMININMFMYRLFISLGACVKIKVGKINGLTLTKLTLSNENFRTKTFITETPRKDFFYCKNDCFVRDKYRKHKV